MHERVRKTALNTKLKEKCGRGAKHRMEQRLNVKTKKIDDSKGLKGCVQWLCTPERRKMVMDRTKDRHEDSERRTKTATQNIK